MSRPADANWVRDRFPQLADAVPVGDELEEGGEARVFEARDFESGAVVLLTLWRMDGQTAAWQLADLERRAKCAPT